MISLSRYSNLFARPALRRVILLSLLGRLPIGMTGLAVVMLIEAREGSFLPAGLTVALYLLGLASVAPLFGRAMDRIGPRPVLLGTGLLYPVALASLLFASASSAPMWVVLATAFVSGAMLPQVTTTTRTFYRHTIDEEDLLSTALSFDSVIIEVVFVVGPMLVALIVGLWSPAAAVMGGALAGSAGALLIAGSDALHDWRKRSHATVHPMGPLVDRQFRVLLGIQLGYATAFGFIEIGAIARAADLGQSALGGVFIGLMSIGSVTGGLTYGSRPWHRPLASQFAIALAAMGLTVLPLALASDPLPFGFVCVLSGIAMAPPLIIQSMIVAKSMPVAQMAESFTWVTTAMLCGVSAGFGLAGIASELAGTSATFIAGSLICLLMAVFAHSYIKHR